MLPSFLENKRKSSTIQICRDGKNFVSGLIRCNSKKRLTSSLTPRPIYFEYGRNIKHGKLFSNGLKASVLVAFISVFVFKCSYLCF